MSAPKAPGPSPESEVRDLSPQAYVTMTRVLRLGLLLALSVLGIVVSIYVAVHPTESFSSVLSANPITDYLTPGGLAAGLDGLHLEAFLTVGILLLIATPIVRVFAGFYYFRRQGHAALSRVTFVVFVLLLLGLLALGPLLH